MSFFHNFFITNITINYFKQLKLSIASIPNLIIFHFQNKFIIFYWIYALAVFRVIIKLMQSAQQKLISRLQTAKQGLTSVKSLTDLSIDAGKSYVATIASKNFEKYQLIVQNQQLQNQLKYIEWRSKTQLPIVKVLFYKILQRKLLNQCSVVQVAIETFPSTLQSLPKMPLFQILYLMKQSLIGFQRLFDRFGAFDITSKMIFLNKNSKCRVWVNENITLNYPSKRSKCQQHEYLASINRLFEQKCIKSTLSVQFFNHMMRINRLVEALQIIQNFTKNNKIILSNKLTSIFQSLGSKRYYDKCDDGLQKIPEIDFGHESLRKIPKFITQLREEKAHDRIDSKSFDSPCKSPLALNKHLSQARLVTRPSYGQKFQIDSTGKSNVSPSSQISQDCKLSIKSINNDTGSVRPAKRLIKQNSQQTINTFATMIPRTKPFHFQTDKNIKHEVHQDLYLTKQTTKAPAALKCRKMSNGEEKKQMLNDNSKGKLKNDKNKHEQMVIKISQQTAATLDQFTKRTAKQPQKMGHLRQKAPDFQSLKPFDHENENDFFQKNGWFKRMNTLMVDNNNIRDTLHSHYDGPQTFSQQIMRSGQHLTLLGGMGKQLQSSYMQD